MMGQMNIRGGSDGYPWLVRWIPLVGQMDNPGESDG